MRSESEEHPPNNSASVTLRPAHPGDEAFLYELYASTRMDEIAAWGWDEAQRGAFLKMQFTAQSQSYRIQYPQADHRLILLDGRPIGRIMVDRTDEEIRLVDIALLPEHRNAGIGTSLIRDLFAEATEAGRPVRLQVLKTNRAARLYRRLGFLTTGEDDLYVQMEWRPGR